MVEREPGHSQGLPQKPGQGKDPSRARAPVARGCVDGFSTLAFCKLWNMDSPTCGLGSRPQGLNPVPRTYIRAFGAVPCGVQNIHPRTYVRGFLWYGVKRSGPGHAGSNLLLQALNFFLNPLDLLLFSRFL